MLPELRPIEGREVRGLGVHTGQHRDGHGEIHRITIRRPPEHTVDRHCRFRAARENAVRRVPELAAELNGLVP